LQRFHPRRQLSHLPLLGDDHSQQLLATQHGKVFRHQHGVQCRPIGGRLQAEPLINYPFTLDELFDNAEVIVRATAVGYNKPPDDPRFITTGEADSTIEFRIEEKLKGKDVPDTITLNGYLSDKDDFNEMPVPYMFVRPYGRRGSCFANTYKEGAQFLLFLKKTKDGYTPNISALGPTNEQLHSDNDAWLVWVRDHLKSLEKIRK
jgi:hypothetical protein